MTILASDDFAGLGTSDLEGRTANNALGGTGSRAWIRPATSVSLFGNGSGAIVGANTGANNFIEITGANKARVRINPNGATDNLAIWGRRDNATLAAADGVLILLASNQTSLRAASIAAGSRTDHATATITAPGTTYWLELEVSGLVLTGRVLNNDLSVRNTVTHTFGGSVPSGGDYWGFSFYSAGANAIFDDFLVEDGVAGAPPAGTVTIGTIVPGSTSAVVPYTYDAADADGFEQRLDGGTPAAIGASPATITGLTASTTYDIEVRAINADGDGTWSAVETFTTTTPDTTVPVLTGAITVGAKSNGTIAISWPTGTDNVAVSAYDVRVDGGSWASQGTSTSTIVTGLTQLTSYTLEVTARDAAGNRSTPPLSVTTSTYRDGATGQYILDNTGPVGDNPGGILYNDVEAGDEDKWFSFVITTPPATGTLDINPDGTFTFVGSEAATMYYQLEVDGANVGSPQLVDLYEESEGPVDPPVFSGANDALNSIIIDKLRSLGFVGGINDMLYAFYGGSGTIQDRERAWLISEASTSQGSNRDLWTVYLRQLGYTGSFSDMIKSFWINYEGT